MSQLQAGGGRIGGPTGAGTLTKAQHTPALAVGAYSADSASRCGSERLRERSVDLSAGWRRSSEVGSGLVITSIISRITMFAFGWTPQRPTRRALGRDEKSTQQLDQVGSVADEKKPGL